MRFAVDLFDVDESRIAPGDAKVIRDLGGATPAASPGPRGSANASHSPEAGTPSPSTGSGSAAATPDRPAARDELWVPILLVVLAFLLIEWAVYQRDALIRAWRSVRARATAVTGRSSGGG